MKNNVILEPCWQSSVPLEKKIKTLDTPPKRASSTNVAAALKDSNTERKDSCHQIRDYKEQFAGAQIVISSV